MTRPRPGIRLISLTAMVALAAATGCSNDSREMRPPAPDQTTTTRPPITVEEPGPTEPLDTGSVG